ncbi:MAG: ATP-dependent RNA helicase DbpA [Sulfurovum sp.]|nr:ATP-dependent RNA helicase DbpA [Sulfurovum sp.]
MKPFHTIPAIPKALIDTLKQQGFTLMTPIQERAIPAVLAHQDILAQSKTGSGKTLAFGLPLVMNTDTSLQTPQHLVITPTRELAQQIAEVLRQLAAYKANLKVVTLYGGVPLRQQADSLAKGAHILIGTPGRLMDHLGKGTLHLDGIKTLVLDEADRMLDMGFYDDILKITKTLPLKRQTLLFSATFAEKIETLAATLLHSPVTIKVDTEQTQTKIEEHVYISPRKKETLRTLIQNERPDSLLVFCNTKADVIEIASMLEKLGHDVIALHGDLDQPKRDEAVILFSNGSKRIMVATDVASRGLDISGIDMVINYDLPFDEEVYTHRIGRTGRADATGTAISLYTPGSRKTDYILERAAEKKLEKQEGKPYLMRSPFKTIGINGGKRTKLRKGDILGTLCKEIGIDNAQIGKIDITERQSYVALHRDITDKVLKALKRVKIKKKKYVAWRVS